MIQCEKCGEEVKDGVVYDELCYDCHVHPQTNGNEFLYSYLDTLEEILKKFGVHNITRCDEYKDMMVIADEDNESVVNKIIDFAESTPLTVEKHDRFTWMVKTVLF